jgi:hypothetical protein
MHPLIRHQTTSAALLPLVILVGGVGSSLHALVNFAGSIGCCWHGFSSCCSAIDSATRRATAGGKESPAAFANESKASSDPCPICSLLAQYRAERQTPQSVARDGLPPRPVAAVLDVAAARIVLASHRPRGPPR